MTPVTPKIMIISSDTGGGGRFGVQALVKSLIILTIVFSGVTVAYSQEVTVKATTNPKEIKAILAKEREASRANRAFYDEEHRCRAFLKTREWQKGEASCRLGVSLVDKLPADQALAKSSVRGYLAVALLWQGRSQEAIPLLKKSLEIRIPQAGESDADTADLYSLLGNAYGLLKDVQTARVYFEKAESSYRAAFLSIGDDCYGIRYSYPRRMKNAIEAHYNVVKSAGISDDADKLQVRLAEVEKEFEKYLKGQYQEADFTCK